MLKCNNARQSVESIDSLDSMKDKDNEVVSEMVNALESSSRFRNLTFKERIKTKERPKKRSKQVYYSREPKLIRTSRKDQDKISKCLFRKSVNKYHYHLS